MNNSQSKFGGVQIAIIILTLATALIHIGLAFLAPDPVFTPVFILNGLGYLALLGAFFLPIDFLRERHNLVRWLFIVFTSVTILGWLAIGDKSWPGGALGYVTKLIEIVLLGLLVVDGRQTESE